MQKIFRAQNPRFYLSGQGPAHQTTQPGGTLGTLPTPPATGVWCGGPWPELRPNLDYRASTIAPKKCLDAANARFLTPTVDIRQLRRAPLLPAPRSWRAPEPDFLRSVPLADDPRARSSSGRKCALRADASTRCTLFALRWTPCRARARAAIPRRTASAAARRGAASVSERGRTPGFGGSDQRRGAVERPGARTTRGSRCGSLETAVASHIAYRGTSHALPACPLASRR